VSTDHLVNQWIVDASGRGASDVHLEPEKGDQLRVRFRVDGRLHHIESLAGARRIGSRVKHMADLDVNENRMPLDGRIRMGDHDERLPNLDIRVSTAPCMHGEKVVLRLIDNTKLNMTMEDLGFSPNMLRQYKTLVNAPHGLILHVGPTGSGKTTSLYAVLKTLHKSDVNIQTVEDPIEYDLPGVTQTQVNEELGLTFPRVLRALLRQDPDIIMVGEIRDADTATIATEAAMTGHLVLSTLHTNDAVGTVVRLLDMGIAPYCIAYAIRCVVSQRFVRKLCDRCKRKVQPDAATIKLLGGVKRPVYEHKGCPKCYKTGFKGRNPVFEFLPMTPALRRGVYDGATPDVLQQIAEKHGLVSMWRDAVDKVVSGTTSVEEALRVVKGVRDMRKKRLSRKVARPAAAQQRQRPPAPARPPARRR